MLNEFRSTSITWDKATRRIYSPITANASDENGRKLVVQIVNGGQVEDLTGSTLHLYWETRDKAHDGLDVFKAVDLEKGEFELSYTTGMLSNQGVLNANLVLIDTVGRVVSERFKITVTEGIDNDAIQSENSFSSLTQALIDISNLEQNYAPRLNDLTAQLQQIAVDVRSFGAVAGTDSTIAIQSAINYVAGFGGGVVKVKEEYLIKAHVDNPTTPNYLGDEGGVALADNVTLDLRGGGTLVALTNDKPQYNVVRVFNKKNVVIIGGVIRGDRYSHTGFDGEWGYGIAVTAGENIKIIDTSCINFWGDGINFQVRFEDFVPTYPTNIHIENVTCNNNRRQGMSIECMVNGVIRNSTFKNTYGIAPQCGVDLEPWDPSIPVKNVIFENCIFENNKESGILIMMAEVQNIKLNNCTFDNNHAEAGQIRTLAGAGNITIDDCIIKRGENGKEDGILLQDGKGFKVRNTKLYECSIRPLASVGKLVSDVQIDNCEIVFKEYEVTTLFVTPKLSENIEVRDTLFDLYESPGGIQTIYLMGENIKFKGNTIKNSRSGVTLESQNCIFEDNNFEGVRFSAVEMKQGAIFKNNQIAQACYDNNNEPVIIIYNEANNAVLVDNIYRKKSYLPLTGTGFPNRIIGFISGNANTAEYLFIKNNAVLSDTKIPLFLETEKPLNTTNFLQGENTNALYGKTVARPNNPALGLAFFDSDVGKAINWNGTNWVDSDGTIV